MKYTNTLLSLILLVCLFAAYQIWRTCDEARAIFFSSQTLIIQCETLVERANNILERKPWRPFGDEPPNGDDKEKEGGTCLK